MSKLKQIVLSSAFLPALLGAAEAPGVYNTVAECQLGPGQVSFFKSFVVLAGGLGVRDTLPAMIIETKIEPALEAILNKGGIFTHFLTATKDGLAYQVKVEHKNGAAFLHVSPAEQGSETRMSFTLQADGKSGQQTTVTFDGAGAPIKVQATCSAIDFSLFGKP